MERIQEIAFLVFGQLAVGGVFLLSLPSLETVGLGFFRTNGSVFFTSTIAGLALFPPFWQGGRFMVGGDGALVWRGAVLVFFSLFTLLLFVYNLRLWFRHPHHSRPLLWGGTGVGILAILSTVGYYLPSGASPLRAMTLSIYFLASSLLLGAGVLGMLLGHSYLTRPALSIVPLRNLAKLFMIFVIVEAALAGANLFLIAPSERLRDALRLNTFEGLYLWIRILIGLVGPLILAPMILQTVKERATMSATGLLYIAMLMVIVGEIFSRFFLLIDAGYL